MGKNARGWGCRSAVIVLSHSSIRLKFKKEGRASPMPAYVPLKMGLIGKDQQPLAKQVLQIWGQSHNKVELTLLQCPIFLSVENTALSW